VASLSLATDLDGLFAITEADEVADTVWLGSTSDGLVELDAATFEATGTTVDPDWVEEDQNIGNLLYSHSAGSYFHVVNDGEDSCLIGWDADGATGDEICPDWSGNITSVSEDRRTGTWWAGTEEGIVYHYDPAEDEVVAELNFGSPIRSLYFAAGAGQLLVLWDNEDSDIAIFLPTYGSLLDTVELRDAEGDALFQEGSGDITQTCDGTVWVTDSTNGNVHAFDMGIRGLCPGGIFNLSETEILGSPDGGETAVEMGFIGPPGLQIETIGWALGYQTLSDGWLDEFRLEIIDPEGESLLLGGAEGAFGAPDDEELDVEFGWPAEPGYEVNIAEEVEAFAGSDTGEMWTIRAYGTWQAIPHGLLVDGSHINFATVEALDAEITSIDVDASADSANVSVGVLTRGSNTNVGVLIGEEGGSMLPRGATTVPGSDSEQTAQINATGLSCETSYEVNVRARNQSGNVVTMEGSFQTDTCPEDTGGDASGDDNRSAFSSCSMAGANGKIDPLMPLLFMLAMIGLAARRRA